MSNGDGTTQAAKDNIAARLELTEERAENGRRRADLARVQDTAMDNAMEVGRLRLELDNALWFARNRNDLAGKLRDQLEAANKAKEYAERCLMLCRRERGWRWALRQAWHGWFGPRVPTCPECQHALSDHWATLPPGERTCDGATACKCTHNPNAIKGA